MTELLTTESLIALLTLSGLEIVLGIDNIVFISILVAKLPPADQPRVRRIGLVLAMGMRIVLLLAISWVMGLTKPLFAVLDHAFAGRDLILLLGGLFLVAKATWEIHDKLEGADHASADGAKARAAIGAVLLQIVMLDIVFSLDSVITAVGMARHIEIMIAAVVVAVGVMLVFAGAIGAFIERHPTMKILALSFLLLIGVVLMADGFGQHVSKGYIYFAMAFSLFVEILNIRIRRPKAVPIRLHQRYVAQE
ncbi:MAG: TerC family protein [Myxococcota bacterium]